MLLGADESVKTDYVSSTKQAFVNHNAPRPQREKRNANEASGFAGPDASRRMVTDLPKNKIPEDVQAQRLSVCREALAKSSETKSNNRTVSQVDCSIMGAPFRGASETAVSLRQGREGGGSTTRPSTFKTDFEPPRHPILHTPLAHKSAVYEHPNSGGDRSLNRLSLNAAQRHQQMQSYHASASLGSSFQGGVHL